MFEGASKSTFMLFYSNLYAVLFFFIFEISNQTNIWRNKFYFFHLYLPYYLQLKTGTSFVNNMTSSANKYKNKQISYK